MRKRRKTDAEDSVSVGKPPALPGKPPARSPRATSPNGNTGQYLAVMLGSPMLEAAMAPLARLPSSLMSIPVRLMTSPLAAARFARLMRWRFISFRNAWNQLFPYLWRRVTLVREKKRKKKGAPAGRLYPNCNERLATRPVECILAVMGTGGPVKGSCIMRAPPPSYKGYASLAGRRSVFPFLVDTPAPPPDPRAIRLPIAPAVRGLVTSSR
eukprot:619055-Prorocentrum_minimum.AAC.3